MACSPDGSQSVWKRTLSAASAVATHATLAAMTPNARITDFMVFPRAPQASGDESCSRERGLLESKIAPRPAPLCLRAEQRATAKALLSLSAGKLGPLAVLGTVR